MRANGNFRHVALISSKAPLLCTLYWNIISPFICITYVVRGFLCLTTRHIELALLVGPVPEEPLYVAGTVRQVRSESCLLHKETSGDVCYDFLKGILFFSTRFHLFRGFESSQSVDVPSGMCQFMAEREVKVFHSLKVFSSRYLNRVFARLVICPYACVGHFDFLSIAVILNNLQEMLMVYRWLGAFQRRSVTFDW